MSKERNWQHQLDLWANKLKGKGKRISTYKTKAMGVSNDRSRKVNILIHNSVVVQVESTKYLGTLIQARGRN